MEPRGSGLKRLKYDVAFANQVVLDLLEHLVVGGPHALHVSGAFIENFSDFFVDAVFLRQLFEQKLRDDFRDVLGLIDFNQFIRYQTVQCLFSHVGDEFLGKDHGN